MDHLGQDCPPEVTPHDHRVPDSYHSTLTAPVTADEVHKALWGLGPDKAPGPDGFPPYFFRRYWAIVGTEVVAAIQAAFSGRGIPEDWKRTLVTLIPKRPDASAPEHYRPISLCTTLYKICARVIVARLKPVIPRLISFEQAAFIQGRSITDNVLLAHEFMHDLQHASARHPLMAIKLDMERAYDRTSWRFLRSTLQGFGFPDICITWIMDCVQAPTFAILINGTPTEYFHSTIGLRQGCPLSPFLFILCADALSRALKMAVCSRQLDPYWPAIDAPPLSHLLFADDCLLLGRASVRNAVSFRSIIAAYCHNSGQTVNLHKSSVHFSPKIRDRTREVIQQRLGIRGQDDHLMYLGVPITGRRPRRSDFSFLEQRVRDRIHSWQVSSLSMMGRLTLIKSVLTAIPMYFISHSLVPVACLRRIERYLRDFLWGANEGSRSPHLLSWDTVCRPVQEGGLGIQSLILQREAMLAKHASRFILDPDSSWSTIMRARYGDWSHYFAVQPPHRASYLWREICSRSAIVMAEITWMIGDGTSVSVVHDPWITTTPISKWPTFVSIDLHYHSYVSDLLCPDRGGWSHSEVARFFGPSLADRILALPTSTFHAPDIRVWRHSYHSTASLRDLTHIMRSTSDDCLDIAWIWKLHLHPRVRLFIWKVARDRLPTCYLLQRRGITADSCCPICGLADETTEHAILSCPRVTPIWRSVGLFDWDRYGGHYREAFLDSLRRGARTTATLTAYMAYHIWLSRNRQVFTSETVPIHCILRSAMAHASEARYIDTLPAMDIPGLWDSHAAPAASRSAVSISWEPPPPGFVKINYDGSVRGSRSGAGFVIRDSCSRLLAATGIALTETSVVGTELYAAWAAIIYAVQSLRTTKLFIEGDAIIVADWIGQRTSHRGSANPMLRDIWTALRTVSSVIIRHVYREANSAADWVASYAATSASIWTWTTGDPCPPELQTILYADLLGLTRTRMV